MNLLLIFSFALIQILRSLCTGDLDFLQKLSSSDEDGCNLKYCVTPDRKQGVCCDGYICTMPAMYDPQQRPKCRLKSLLLDIHYNFGYQPPVTTEKTVDNDKPRVHDWRDYNKTPKKPYNCSVEGEECRIASYRKEDCCDGNVCIQPEPFELNDKPLCTSILYIPALNSIY